MNSPKPLLAPPVQNHPINITPETFDSKWRPLICGVFIGILYKSDPDRAGLWLNNLATKFPAFRDHILNIADYETDERLLRKTIAFPATSDEVKRFIANILYRSADDWLMDQLVGDEPWECSDRVYNKYKGMYSTVNRLTRNNKRPLFIQRADGKVVLSRIELYPGSPNSQPSFTNDGHWLNVYGRLGSRPQNGVPPLLVDEVEPPEDRRVNGKIIPLTENEMEDRQRPKYGAQGGRGMVFISKEASSDQHVNDHSRAFKASASHCRAASKKRPTGSAPIGMILADDPIEAQAVLDGMSKKNRAVFDKYIGDGYLTTTGMTLEDVATELKINTEAAKARWREIRKLFIAAGLRVPRRVNNYMIKPKAVKQVGTIRHQLATLTKQQRRDNLGLVA